jgi:acyl transferase domain-containing protein
MSSNTADNRSLDNAIAIVGMYARVPGADGLDAFWNNLEHGVDSITHFTDNELRNVGVDEQTLRDPDYVKASGRLDGVELFDAPFFDMTPREVEILDPQHRILLEGVWRALEHAGVDPQRYPGRIGLFAGVGFNGYLVHNILPNRSVIEQSGAWQLSISNDKDFAPTRIAYKLNLQGAAVAINTACSTSLVATAMAASSLLNYQCDAVVAGGCSLNLPQDEGYLHVPGGTLSSDGHCRPFDAQAGGTVDGNGTACVVLKRYTDAIADGDTIYAVISGFAINNDGSVKVGYTAPGVAGQADVILEAMQLAGVQASDIDYIETHGTATELGDTVEISALREAFTAAGGTNKTCYIGSVKSNIGHLDTAAGASGLIKTVLALQHSTIPPTCHFKQANPLLQLEDAPFTVNSERVAWQASPDRVRRAGVSSFGIGGTNAHVIVEEAPVYRPIESESRQNDPLHHHFIPVSAKSAKALALSLDALQVYMRAHPDVRLQDIAYTLQQGRTRFDYRALFIASAADHSKLLETIESCSNKINSILAGKVDGSLLREAVNNTSLEHLTLNGSVHTHETYKQWLDGKEPDWNIVGSKGKKVALPGHPFIKSRYWIDAPLSVSNLGPSSDASAPHVAHEVRKLPDVDSWFYIPSWQHGLPTLNAEALKARWLIFDDGSEVTKHIADDLKTHGADVKIVRECIFTDDPNWLAILNELGSWKPEKMLITGFLGLQNLEKEEASYVHLFDRAMALSAALQKTYFSEEIELITLVSNLLEYPTWVEARREQPGINTAQTITSSTAIGRSVLLGPLRVLPQECPNISTRFIDVDASASRTAILCALSSTAQGSTVALRGNGLRTATYSPLAKPLPTGGKNQIRKGGAYLITGGLGDIGLTLAQYLCDQHQANVILTTRSPLPDRAQWPQLSHGHDQLSRRLRRLIELEQSGARIEVSTADVSNKVAMQALIDGIIHRYHRLDGVIHAAGIVGEASFVTIGESTTDAGRDRNHRQFTPKTHGLDVLESVLMGTDFDFCMVCSSLSPILGGLGFAAYAATNAYVDAKVAVLNTRQPGKWISVNWEGWMFDHDDTHAGAANSSAAELGINAAEGVKAFKTIMEMVPVERLVVSSGDLNRRIAQWISKTNSDTNTKELKSAHPRPDHIGLYTAPITPTQFTLTEQWEQLLGISGIGIHDSFFELGGNSLLLTQLVALIRRHFKAELTLSTLFEQPTIAEMAKGIDSTSQPDHIDEREEGFI